MQGREKSLFHLHQRAKMSLAPVGEASVYELVQNAVCEPGSVCLQEISAKGYLKMPYVSQNMPKL